MKNFDWVLLNDSNPLYNKQYGKIIDDQADFDNVMVIEVRVHLPNGKISRRQCSKVRMDYVCDAMQDFLNNLYGYDKEWHTQKRWDNLLNFD